MSETRNPYDDEVVDPYAGDDVKDPHDGDVPEPAEPSEGDAPTDPPKKTTRATKKK